jgi:hypothetical protein
MGVLPCTSYKLVSHLVEDVPTEDLYQHLLHTLADYQSVELLSKVEPLGARKPSELLATMIELCPRNQLDSPFFFYFFLQRLPRKTRVLLSMEDPRDIRAITEKADRLATLHVTQHHDPVAAVAASSDDETADVAAVKQNKAKKHFKKKKPANKKPATAIVCWYHTTFGEKAHRVSPPAPGQKTNCPGWRAVRPRTLFYITDTNSGKRFLVDSGSTFSILPFA